MSERPYDRSALIGWYDAYSDTCDEECFHPTEDNYAGDRFRAELVARTLAELGCETVLDVGCGTAWPAAKLIADGRRVRGFDLSPGMIAEARKKAKAAGLPEDTFVVGDVLDPGVVGTFGEATWDAVVTNGVLSYVEDVEAAHRHIAAFLKPGGYYLGTYANRLFDLSTFNRFTLDFFDDLVLAESSLSPDLRRQVQEGLRGLVTHPDEPEYIPHSARQDIYMRSDNPLTLGKSLEEFGLFQDDILFYKYHAWPPLLKELSGEVKEEFMRCSNAFEIDRARDWRGYFLCTTFIVVARKEA